MKEYLRNKIVDEIEATDFFENLPEKIHEFKLKLLFSDDVDKFFYFTYENSENHRALTAYFHEETEEYKIRVKIGLTEFCLTRFFTRDFETFCEKISAFLEMSLEKISVEHVELNPLIESQKISSWAYGKNLPKQIAGFELFISPEKPVEYTNGSYIIINYSDFKNFSDFSLTYNIFTENFSAELTINHVPKVTYLFDAKNLIELEKKLDEHLSAELSKIREQLDEKFFQEGNFNKN